MVKTATRKTRSGPGRPAGSSSSYNKVIRRQGNIASQREFRVRMSNEQERSFIEEAADSLDESLSAFGATASLERAEKILLRSRPVVPATA